MGARYVVTVAISSFLIAVFAGLLGAALPGAGPLLLVLAALALYATGLALDVLPPGRPVATWPKLPLVRRPSREARLTAAILAVLGFGLLGATAFGNPDETPALEALPGGSDGLSVDAAAAEPPPATPTTAPTSEPTAAPAGVPTEAPAATVAAGETSAATPADLDVPAEPPTPTPTPDPIVTETEALQAGWLTGRWEVTNTVERGPGTGETTSIVVDLHEAAGQVEGTGEGLTLSGVRQGEAFAIIFRRPDGSGGRYVWTTRPDGRLAGTFAEEATGNSGTSTAHRLP